MAYSKNRRTADLVSDVNGNISVEGLVVPTQSASDNDTSAASTAYVTTAVAGLIDSAPGTLNTLNEIAAALNDDANFNTTVTNLIAAKLPLAGGTLTGALVGTSSTMTGGFLGGSNGGIRIHTSGTKFFNITAANSARDGIMDIGASDARFKDLFLSGTTTAGALTLNSGGVITQTVGSSGGVYHSITHTGSESWTWAAQNGSGSVDYLDLGISGGTRCMTWTDQGKVGIGTTAPSRNLTVNSTGQTDLTIRSGDSSYSQLMFGDQSADNRGGVLYNNADEKMHFNTTTTGSGDSHITIDGVGKVGIGTTSPSTDLHLYSTVDSRPHLLLEGVQNHDTDDAPILEFYTNDSTTGGIGDNTYVGEIIFSGDEKDSEIQKKFMVKSEVWLLTQDQVQVIKDRLNFGHKLVVLYKEF